MSEEKIVDEPPVETKPSRLREALNRARQTEVERSDVIVDLREAEIARLELLQDALADVFDEIPEDNDLLGCALIPGTPPRLWIDVLGHVAMGRDKRTYRFLKDSRFGRQVILETTSLDEMANRVTDYVAHRLIERERALESDPGQRPAGAPGDGPASEATGSAAPRSGPGWGAAIAAFIVGILAGAAGLFGLGLYLTSGG